MRFLIIYENKKMEKTGNNNHGKALRGNRSGISLYDADAEEKNKVQQRPLSFFKEKGLQDNNLLSV
jgi:hypothetical protein